MLNVSDLELNIARARIVLSVATVVSIYVDPNVPDMTPWIRLTGGPLVIDRLALATLGFHLLYSLVTHALCTLGPLGPRASLATTVLDVLFGAVVAVFTEGPTSPSFTFFAFAILATGCRRGYRATMLVTACCLVSYLLLVSLSAHASMSTAYLIRPAYLGLTGYLIADLGQQRVNFEAALREHDRRGQRLTIARSLHDGFIQALSGVRLRLVACRGLIERGETGRGLEDLADLDREVAREFDDVRAYVRSLAEVDDPPTTMPERRSTRFDVELRFHADGGVTDHLLRVLLEGVRNVVQHAGASRASLRAEERDGTILVTIDDDGVGFHPDAGPPWAIASRIAELGGRLAVRRGRTGARLEIELPSHSLLSSS